MKVARSNVWSHVFIFANQKATIQTMCEYTEASDPANSDKLLYLIKLIYPVRMKFPVS